MKTIDGLLYKDRTDELWKKLETFECPRCQQICYQQVAGIVVCDDCISTGGTSISWPDYYLATRGVKIEEVGDAKYQILALVDAQEKLAEAIAELCQAERDNIDHPVAKTIRDIGHTLVKAERELQLVIGAACE